MTLRRIDDWDGDLFFGGCDSFPIFFDGDSVDVCVPSFGIPQYISLQRHPWITAGEAKGPETLKSSDSTISHTAVLMLLLIVVY